MVRVLRRVVIFLVGIAVILLGIGFLLPQHQIVERSVVIEADPSDIFPYVSSLQAFSAWSPWADIDPDMEVTYSGPESGVGNTMEWTSEHPDVGNGRQEIIELVENESVLTSLDFGEMGTAEAWWRLTPQDEGTRVIWGLNADMGGNPIGRWFGLMMDNLVGADYEHGLAQLQVAVEG